MNQEKSVDESWKETAETQKENLDHAPAEESKQESPAETAGFEVNFVNYVTSLGFQTMIFLGEIDNPITQKKDQNLDQAKFLIDTLAMLKEKTQGNLSEQEDSLLSATVYELQLKFVEIKDKAEKQE